MIHQHSVAAYHQELPRLSRRAQAIIAWLELHPRSTDREVMIGMGFSDLNCVRPRITELIDSERIVEVGETVCSYSHKTVRLLDLSLDERGRRQDLRVE